MDELVDLAEKISPSLDSNDKTTMKQTLDNLNQRLGHVTQAAEDKQAALEQNVKDWESYQV